MAVAARQVKNKRDSLGRLTGRPGAVYDVNIKYPRDGKWKTYSQKGFNTEKEARLHEAEMKIKLNNPGYVPTTATQRNFTVKEHMETWIEQHKVNLRPSTYDSYKGYIKNYIVPHLGDIKLSELHPSSIDAMLRIMLDSGLSTSSARYAQRVLSGGMEAAVNYKYIESNPAKNILTKLGKKTKVPEPYTIPQMQQLLAQALGTEWEMPIMLAGMYGLRMSEILGLRWQKFNMDKGVFRVEEQLPYKLSNEVLFIEEMAPLKNSDSSNDGKAGARTLPITDAARPFFERQLERIKQQKELAVRSGVEYYDNDLVIAKPNGLPCRRDRVSANFGQMLRRLDLPHIRFHDLRHPYVKLKTNHLQYQFCCF